MSEILSAFGNIEIRGDVDWFRVRLVAGTTYSINTQAFSSGTSVELQVIRPDGELLSQPVQFSNVAQFVAPATGEYFLAITAEGYSGGYQVDVQSIADPHPAWVNTTDTLDVGETKTITYNYSSLFEEDWFAIELTAGQSYVVAAGTQNSDLYIVDDAGAVVAIEGGGQEQVHFTPSQSGRYFVGNRASGSYSLTLSEVADDHGVTPGAAGHFSVGAPVTGQWEAAGDDDWFAVTLQAGASYKFSLDTGIFQLNTSLQIVDASGSVIWENRPGFTPTSAVFTAAVDGTYYVSAGLGSVFSGGGYGPLEYLRGWTYTLSGTQVLGDVAGNALTLTSLSLGAQFNGTWESPGDHDWVRVQLTEGESYLFMLDTETWNYAQFALMDSEGNVLETESGNPYGSPIHYTALATGTFYLAAISGSLPDAYTISAERVEDDFADNTTTTGRVTVGGSVTGTFESRYDADWFAVELNAGFTYTVENGVIIGPDGDYIYSFRPSVAGTYYVAAVGNEGSYTLSVSGIQSYDDYADNADTRGALRQMFNGTGGADNLVGSEDGDELNGLGGNDLLNGGAGGSDVFDGGDGIDTVSYSLAVRAVIVNLAASVTVEDGVVSDQLIGIENVIGSAFADTLQGAATSDRLEGGFGDDVLQGNAGNDTLLGNDGADSLNGGAGADAMTGGAGDDGYQVDNLGDIVTEAAGGGTDVVRTTISYSLAANVEQLVLAGALAINGTGNTLANAITGNTGNNTLDGGAGNDILAGGGGTDKFIGGAGNDQIHVDSSGDVIVEAVGGGTDRVFAATSFVLREGVYVETLSTENDAGTASIDFLGNSLANALIGNAGANIINGGAGADVMTGLAGSDTYYVDNSSDVIVEAAGGGSDKVLTSVSFVLRTGVQVETVATTNTAGTTAISLLGNEFANALLGNAGANTINGGTGADVMSGFAGNDIYYVDNAQDQVYELSGNGTDRIFTSASYTLRGGSFVETISTTNTGGTEAINLGGNETVNALLGNAGANILNGGGGVDTLSGYGGNDQYYVDNALDQVYEGVGGGTDRIFASASYALRAGSEVETISTTNSALATAINLSGNAFANTIYGNAGANILNGGGGADILSGFAGNDSYYVDNAGDQVFETTNGGTDRIFASVDYTLGGNVQVETLSTDNNAGTAGIDLTGNGFANVLYGNAGANVLNGGAGADTMSGFGGADTFAFTTALGGGNVDRIGDFATGVDEIAIDNAVFTGLGLGALSAGAFHTGSAATDADDRIIYNSSTGALFFDADGVGGVAAVQFATLNAGLALSAGDVIVI